MRPLDLIIGDYALYIGLALSVPFIIAYPILAKDWWKTPIGRGMYWMMFELFAVCIVIVVGIIFPEWSFRPTLRFGVFIMFPFAIGNITRLLFKIQIDGYLETRRAGRDLTKKH